MEKFVKFIERKWGGKTPPLTEFLNGFRPVEIAVEFTHRP